MEEQGFTGHHILGGDFANLDSCLLHIMHDYMDSSFPISISFILFPFCPSFI